MSVNIKVTGGLNIEWGQIDPKATGGLRIITVDGQLWSSMFTYKISHGMNKKNNKIMNVVSYMLATKYPHVHPKEVQA